MSSDSPRTKTKKFFAKENEKQFKLLDEKAKEEKKKIDSHKKTRVIGRFSITTTKKPNDSSEKWSDESNHNKKKYSVCNQYKNFDSIDNVFEYYRIKIKKKLKNKIELAKNKNDINFCCNKEESEILKKYIKILFRVKPDMEQQDITIAVIVAYYGLVLGEQTTDYLKENLYRPLTYSAINVQNLIFELTTGNIMDGDINISKKFRQKTLFGNSSSGGGKNSTRKLHQLKK